MIIAIKTFHTTEIKYWLNTLEPQEHRSSHMSASAASPDRACMNGAPCPPTSVLGSLARLPVIVCTAVLFCPAVGDEVQPV
jgi:hypothetical protein